MPLQRRGAVVCALGIAQTLAWASTYYLPALLAPAMARELGVGVPTVFAAFSAALLLAAAIGPFAGRAIDRWGGRPVLSVTSLVFAAGLAALAASQGPWGLFAAWLLIGLGMGSGLYEGAFSALVRWWGADSRNAITGVALFGGLASTVGWPLTGWLQAEFDWRGACLGWAALHLLLGLPLNALLPGAQVLAAPVSPAPATEASAADATAPPPRRTAVLLALLFALTWFISTAMAAHLPRLLQLGGASLAAAVAIGALVGPAQVAGRLLEFGLLRRVHPLLSARIASALHPLAAVLLALLGPPAAIAFALLHGAGNGVLTIAKGTLPLVLFGAGGYGERQGWLMVPARVAQAGAPWLFGLALDRWGAQSLWLSAALGLACLMTALGLSARR